MFDLRSLMVYAGTMGDAKQQKIDGGFDPAALDPAITAARERLTTVIADVETIRTSLSPQLVEVKNRLRAQLDSGTLNDAGLMTAVERQIEWLEKYARVAASFTKVLDEAARLRSFLAGGADSRPDLASLGDADLALIVRNAAKLKSD